MCVAPPTPHHHEIGNCPSTLMERPILPPIQVNYHSLFHVQCSRMAWLRVLAPSVLLRGPVGVCLSQYAVRASVASWWILRLSVTLPLRCLQKTASTVLEHLFLRDKLHSEPIRLHPLISWSPDPETVNGRIQQVSEGWTSDVFSGKQAGLWLWK